MKKFVQLADGDWWAQCKVSLYLTTGEAYNKAKKAKIRSESGRDVRDVVPVEVALNRDADLSCYIEVEPVPRKLNFGAVDWHEYKSGQKAAPETGG